MITFKTTVVVTPEVILDIKEKVMNHVTKSLFMSGIDNKDIDIVGKTLNQAFALLIQQNPKPTRGGWRLSSKEAILVAGFLRMNQKIPAIKEFRSATGADLKEAKTLIDQFGVGEGSAELFVDTFLEV